MDRRFSALVHKLCLAMGPVLTVGYLSGFIFLAHFLPIPSPDWTAEHVASWLLENRSSYLAGCVLMVIASALFAPWGAALSMWTKRTESRWPVVTATQIISAGAGVTVLVIGVTFWALAAFRVGTTSPEITQFAFDTGWFFFLWGGPPFYVWVLSLGVGILMNPPEFQTFPRWTGYYSFASVMSWILGMLMVYFHVGPGAFSGVLPSWIPLGEFFTWVVIMTVYGFRAIRLQERESAELAAVTVHDHENGDDGDRRPPSDAYGGPLVVDRSLAPDPT